MNDTVAASNYFTKAMTEMGETCPVVTTQAIFNDHGVKILEQGVAINLGLYERLIAHKLSKPLEDCVASVNTINGTLLRAHAERALREVPFFDRIGADAKTRSRLLLAFEKQALPDNVAFQLSLVNEVRPALFRHSILIALFAGWLTLDASVSPFDIGMAVTAGLLHDIGMLHLDPELLNPHEVIERSQRRQLYSHPLISSVLIERHTQFPRELVRAVNEHHEFLDGSGYPRHLSGAAISPLGRILSLGELVTSTLADGRGAPEMRLWIKLLMNKHRYDATLTERVEQHLKPQSAVHADGLKLMEDPVSRLLAIDAALSEWPEDYVLRQALSVSRRQDMVSVADQARQMRRTLANVGVASQQLAQLGGDQLDEFLQLELTLLAQEAAWQLRTLARQTKRRWRLAPEAQYPDGLQQWLAQADALVTHI